MVSGARRDITRDWPSSQEARLPFDLFAPDSRRAAIPLASGGVLLVEVTGGAPDVELTAKECDRTFNVAWSPDGELLAVASKSGKVCLFELATHRLLRAWDIPRPGGAKAAPSSASDSPPRAAPAPIVIELAFTPLGNAIVVGTVHPMVTGAYRTLIYRAQSGAMVADLGLVGHVVALGRDAMLFYGFDAPPAVLTADLALTPVRIPPEPLVFSGDGELCAASGGIVALRSGRRIPLEDADDAQFDSFDASAKKLLGHVGDTIKVWDAVDGHLVAITR
jgi:hypothetical protein